MYINALWVRFQGQLPNCELDFTLLDLRELIQMYTWITKSGFLHFVSNSLIQNFPVFTTKSFGSGGMQSQKLIFLIIFFSKPRIVI